MASSSSNVVGVHYRVGKKIGEGSFGVIFEGTNLLNSQQVAIKFVRDGQVIPTQCRLNADNNRNHGKAMHRNSEMNTERTKYLLDAVSDTPSSRKFGFFDGRSRYSKCLLFRSGGLAQYSRNRPLRS
jgi:serine/threonine protein kinase